MNIEDRFECVMDIIKIMMLLLIILCCASVINKIYKAFPDNIIDEKLTFIEQSSDEQLALTVYSDRYILYAYDENDGLEVIQIPVRKTKIYRNLPKDKRPYLKETQNRKPFIPVYYEIYLNES